MPFKLISLIILGLILTTTSAAAFLNQEKIKDFLNNSAIPSPSPLEQSLNTEATSSASPLANTTNKPKASVISTLKITKTKTGETQVEISEETLNNQISNSLSGQSLGSTPIGDATIQDLKVTINQGNILLKGNAKAGFVTAPFQMTATIDLVDSRPEVSITNLSLTGLPLPQVVADQIEGVIQSQVNTLFSVYDFQIKSIAMTSGKIIVVGTY